MSLNLTFKITLTILILISLTLSMISLLNYFKYEKTLTSIILSRSKVTAEDLKSTAESNLKMGLSLAENENIQSVIERIKQLDSQIIQIDIFNNTGLILFSTTPSRTGEMVPHYWLKEYKKEIATETTEEIKKKQKDVWQVSNEKVLNIRTDLFNDFNKVVGGISLQTSKVYLRDKMQEILYQLITTFVVVLVILAIVTMLAIFLLFRQTSNSFNKMNQALANLLTANSKVDDVIFIPKNELEQQCYHFHSQAQNALLELQQAQQQVEENNNGPKRE